jgi:hypothetical protein
MRAPAHAESAAAPASSTPRAERGPRRARLGTATAPPAPPPDLAEELRRFDARLAQRSTQRGSRVAAFSELARALQRGSARDGGGAFVDGTAFAARICAYAASLDPAAEIHAGTVAALFDAIADRAPGSGAEVPALASVVELQCGLAVLFHLSATDAAVQMFDASDAPELGGRGAGVLDVRECARAFSAVVKINALLHPAAFERVDAYAVGAAQAARMFDDVSAACGAEQAALTKAQFVAWFASTCAHKQGLRHGPPEANGTVSATHESLSEARVAQRCGEHAVHSSAHENAAPSDADWWLCRDADGVAEGPFSRNDMLYWLEDSTLEPSTRVAPCSKGGALWGEWRALMGGILDRAAIDA